MGRNGENIRLVFVGRDWCDVVAQFVSLSILAGGVGVGACVRSSFKKKKIFFPFQKMIDFSDSESHTMILHLTQIYVVALP